jgi:hypothetical protein
VEQTTKVFDRRSLRQVFILPAMALGNQERDNIFEAGILTKQSGSDVANNLRVRRVSR